MTASLRQRIDAACGEISGLTPAQMAAHISGVANVVELAWERQCAAFDGEWWSQNRPPRPCLICAKLTTASSRICCDHDLSQYDSLLSALEKTDTLSLPVAADGSLAPLQADVSVSSSALPPVDGALGLSVVPVASPVSDVSAGAGGSVLE